MSSYEHIGPDSDEEDFVPSLQNSDSGSKCRRLVCLKTKAREWLLTIKTTLCSRDFLKALVLGQTVSLFLCGTGVFSTLLQQQGVQTPTAQSFLNYCLLCVVYTVTLACRHRPEQRHLGAMLRHDGWKYALLALIDVEANYLVVKAYSYTTITSVQVLDCFSMVAVVGLSRCLLKARYAWSHLLGVGVSLGGLAALVGADIMSGRNQDSTGGSNKALGDGLVVTGAVLYGVSNVGQEFVVKNYPRSDFLGMIGLFGSFFSGIQLIVLESHELEHLDLTSFTIWGPWLGYVACLFLIYTCMSLAIQHTSATAVNISILSADFYALLFGLFLFHYQFNALYLVAFGLVMLGVVIYSVRPVGGDREQDTQQLSAAASQHDSSTSTATPPQHHPS